MEDLSHQIDPQVDNVVALVAQASCPELQEASISLVGERFKKPIIVLELHAGTGSKPLMKDWCSTHQHGYMLVHFMENLLAVCSFIFISYDSSTATIVPSVQAKFPLCVPPFLSSSNFLFFLLSSLISMKF